MTTDRIARAVKQPVLPTKPDEGAAPKAAPRFLDQSLDAKVHDLKFPMEWDGVEYRRLELKRLKGRHFQKFALLSAMGVDSSEALLSLVADIPVEVARELDGEDFLSLVEMMPDFIPARFLEEKSGQDSPTGPNTQA